MRKRRIFVALLLICFAFSLLTTRLFWIQLLPEHVDGKNLIVRSVQQRQQRLELDSGRGRFVDRNGASLTGFKQWGLAIFPSILHLSTSSAERIAHILKISTTEWMNEVMQLKEPTLWSKGPHHPPIHLSVEQRRALESLQLPGLAVVPYIERYSIPYTAAHLLGYISQFPQRIEENYHTQLEEGRISLKTPIGASGLELQWDETLMGIGPTNLVYYLDGHQRVMKGLSNQWTAPNNPFYPLEMVLTIDAEVQRNFEEMTDQLMSNSHLEAAAVVLMDAESREVLAMLSYPKFSPYDPLKEPERLINHAVKATIPGSIFKIVMTAAALEKGIVSEKERFYCTGSLGKYDFFCWQKEGHGNITLREAFLESCNITYAQLAMMLEPKEVLDTAKALGITDLYHLLPEEENGTVFKQAPSQQDEGIMIQTAIGQRDVRISPLQAAVMVANLLDDGKAKPPRLVKSIRYHTGAVMKEQPEQPVTHASGISETTARVIRSWMHDVVEEGTGTSLRQTIWPLAGKSGTAELGEHGEAGDNEWFVGFGPADDPKYVMAVMVRDTSGVPGHQGTELFGKLFDRLAQLSS